MYVQTCVCMHAHMGSKLKTQVSMKQEDGCKLGNLHFPGCFCVFLSSRVIPLAFPMTSNHFLNVSSLT